MPDVAFDVEGPAGGGGATAVTGQTITWTHVVGSGSDQCLLVYAGIGGTAAGTPATATYDGVAMTKLDTQASNNGSDGYLVVFALLNPHQGSHSVVVTTTLNPFTAGSPGVGLSDSYNNVSALGTPVKAAAATATPSVTVSSAVGNMAVAAHACSLQLTATNQTLRNRVRISDSNAAGNLQGVDAAGASSVVLSGTHAADWWAAIGLDLVRVADPSAVSGILRNEDGGVLLGENGIPLFTEGI